LVAYLDQELLGRARIVRVAVIAQREIAEFHGGGSLPWPPHHGCESALCPERRRPTSIHILSLRRSARSRRRRDVPVGLRQPLVQVRAGRDTVAQLFPEIGI